MAGSPKAIPDFAACNAPATTDLLLGQGNSLANTFKYSVQTLLGNSSANVVVANSKVLSTNTLIVRKSNTPANSTVGGHPNNSIWFDDSYIYVSTSNGTIKRVLLSLF